MLASVEYQKDVADEHLVRADTSLQHLFLFNVFIEYHSRMLFNVFPNVFNPSTPKSQNVDRKQRTSFTLVIVIFITRRRYGPDQGSSCPGPFVSRSSSHGFLLYPQKKGTKLSHELLNPTDVHNTFVGVFNVEIGRIETAIDNRTEPRMHVKVGSTFLCIMCCLSVYTRMEAEQ